MRRGERTRIIKFLLRAPQQGHHFFNLARIPPVLSQVVQFIRIILQVEQLREIDLRIANELPPIIPNGTLHILIKSKHRLSVAPGFPRYYTRLAFTLDLRWNGCSGEFAYGGEKIVQL